MYWYYISKKPRFYKFLICYFIIALMTFFCFPKISSAAALTSISDTLTRLKATTLSSHTVGFSLDSGNTLAANEHITIDFDENGSKFTVDGANTTTADLGVTVGGSAKTIVDVDGSCVGHADTSDIVASVNDATGVLDFLTCGSYSASGTGAAIIVYYGTSAGGTNRVTNPAVGSYTISITDAGGDSGNFVVTIITEDQVMVSTTIDPYLTFAITTTSVSLTGETGSGNPSYTDTGINEGDDNTLAAATNSNGGYNITYNGATLTNGGNTITAMNNQGASTKNSEQFGINLMANTTPLTGVDPSGGIGAPTNDYNDTNQFKFVASTTTPLASAGGPSNTTTYTVSYIVNVAGSTEPITYSTTITYICTGQY